MTDDFVPTFRILKKPSRIMVEVKPISVVCSSENPAFPAINLLRGAYKSLDERKPWLCSGEKSAFVIIKYFEPFIISSIELKNAGSAFIQVEGANSLENSPFTILWRQQHFISALESKTGTNIDGTYSFLCQDLTSTEKHKKWDTLKIVCCQPFSTNMQFGLSYVIARTAPPIKEEPIDIPMSGATALPNCDSVGSSLAVFQQAPVKVEPLSNNVAASSISCKLFSKSSLKEGSTVIKQEASSSDDLIGRDPTCSLVQDNNTSLVSREVNVIVVEDSSDENDDELAPHDSDQQSSTCSPMKRQSSDSQEPHAVKRSKPAVTYKPFNKLLEGVKIVISGFINPQRAEIRERALKMGATYSPYWSEGSTHLICAFLYTPKYRQALGEGLIVTREWLDECFLQRKRLPWRRFALNMSERCIDADDAEIWELQPCSSASSSQSFSSAPPGAENDATEEESLIEAINVVQPQTPGAFRLLLPRTEPEDVQSNTTSPSSPAAATPSVSTDLPDHLNSPDDQIM